MLLLASVSHVQLLSEAEIISMHLQPSRAVRLKNCWNAGVSRALMKTKPLSDTDESAQAGSSVDLLIWLLIPKMSSLKSGIATTCLHQAGGKRAAVATPRGTC